MDDQGSVDSCCSSSSERKKGYYSEVELSNLVRSLIHPALQPLEKDVLGIEESALRVLGCSIDQLMCRIIGRMVSDRVSEIESMTCVDRSVHSKKEVPRNSDNSLQSTFGLSRLQGSFVPKSGRPFDGFDVCHALESVVDVNTLDSLLLSYPTLRDLFSSSKNVRGIPAAEHQLKSANLVGPAVHREHFLPLELCETPNKSDELHSYLQIDS